MLILFIASNLLLQCSQATMYPVQPKPMEPLVQELNTKNINSKLVKTSGLDKKLLNFSLAVTYFKESKWKQAYNLLNGLSDLKYLDRHIKYFKSISAINAYDDSAHIRSAVNDLYYLNGRGGTTAEDLKQYIAKAEFKLSLAEAKVSNYILALDLLSRARKNSYSDLKSEFELASIFTKWDKKISHELILELYRRFGDNVKPYLLKLNKNDKQEIEDAIGIIVNRESAESKIKTQVVDEQAELSSTISNAIENKDYSSFKSNVVIYLRKYNRAPYNRDFYNKFASFMEASIIEGKHSASYFDDVLEHTDKDYVEKLALRFWQRSAWKDTEHLLKLLTKKFPLYDKGQFLLASYYEDRDERSNALEHYKNLVDEFPKSTYYPRSLFKYAWLKMLNKDYKTCADLFSRYLNEGGESYDWAITAAMYFQSRCMDRSSKKEDAGLLKQELISKYPFSFYSLIAMDELDMDVVKSLEESIKPVVYSEEAVSPQDLYTMNTASLLIRAGVLDWARKELSVIDLDRLSPEYLEIVSDMYKLANMHDMAFIAAGKLMLNLKGYSSRDHAQMHFPKPYMDIVDNFSKATGVEPYIIFAIMKRESAFNKDAVSRAGAMGLMQLMPYTAQRVEPGIDHKKLKDAETNIRLASLYLKKLFEKYNGNLIYVAAAYNAGEENLDRWVKWYGSKLDNIEFIENIPFFETRAYVKSVVANYYMYNALYMKKKIDIDHVIRIDLKKGE
jgi:soluble lytic murein transglycosylase-like protein